MNESNPEHKLGNERKNIFSLPLTPYGIGDSERCIEIPWAMTLYQNEHTVLDIGYAHAEERYLKALMTLNIPELHGIDIVGKKIDGIISHVEDIRKTNFSDNFFDYIFCISTIEHIGKDNSIYTRKDYENEIFGDIAALKEIYRITKPNGKVVITLPFGKYQDYGWFINYNSERLEKLLRSSQWERSIESYFKYDCGWFNCKKEDLRSILYKDNEAPAAAGLACILLIKPEIKKENYNFKIWNVIKKWMNQVSSRDIFRDYK